MATVKKRGNKYNVIYDYTSEEGQRKQKWKSFDKKADAEKYAKEIEYKKSHDCFVTPNNQTVTEFFREWVPIQAKTRWQYKTYSSNLQYLDLHILPALGDIVLQELTAKHIEVFFMNLRTKKVSGSKAHNKAEDEIPYLSSTTQYHIYVFLKGALDTAVEWKLISENPVKCKPPKRFTRVNYSVINPEKLPLGILIRCEAHWM